MKEQKLSNRFCPEGMTVEEWQVGLRREFAEQNPFDVEHLDENRIWGDYLVANGRNRYRVAFRGVRSERNYCSCLDFRTNGLGTCKHIEAVTLFLQDQVPGYPWGEFDYTPEYSSIYVSYKGGRSIKMRVGREETARFEALRARFFDESGTLPPENYSFLPQICDEAKDIAASFRCYEDVFDLTQEHCRRMEWQDYLRETNPDKRVDNEYTANMPEEMRRHVYDLAYEGHGVMVGLPSDVIVREVVALADVYLRDQPGATGYVIINDPQRFILWRNAFANPVLRRLPIEVMHASAFVKKVANNVPPCTFMFVEQAARLKEWRDPVSVAIKRMQIDHLYMNLETIEDLTPVQFSSVVQHIDPFILGPFYRFIRDYRPIFPLRNDGSNLPDDVRDFMFLYTSDSIREMNEMLPPIRTAEILLHGTDAEEEIDKLLRHLNRVLSNDTLREVFLKRISMIVGAS